MRVSFRTDEVRTDEARSSALGLRAARLPARRQRVILVGGEPEMDLMCDLLAAAGHEVRVVPDCEAAEALAGEADLVVLDPARLTGGPRLLQSLLRRVAQDPDGGIFAGKVGLVPSSILLGRSADGYSRSGVLKVRDLEIDLARCEASRQGVKLDLTPTQFRLLRYLALHAGHVVPAAELLRSAQDYPLDWSDQDAQEIVKVHIRHLRHRLEPDPHNPTYILNVRGFGYMLERRER